MRSSCTGRSRAEHGVRALRRRALVLALAVGLGSASVAIGSASAGAAVTCVAGSNCAPNNVHFFDQATQPYRVNSAPGNGFEQSGIQVCGLEGSFAPLSARTVDFQDDIGFKPAGDGPTNEGNYTDSEPFGFRPSTSLSPGDTIDIRLPHPGEPYKGSGSVLPPPQVS